MEINNSKTYLAIAIIGTVIGLLYLFLQDNVSLALTILFGTFYIIVLLRYFLEWLYYKKHKAITASFQFLLLPYLIMIVGTIISPYSYGPNIVVNLLLFSTLFNFISLSLFLPLIILGSLFSKFHSKRWPGIAFKRKIKRGRALPISLHTLFTSLIIFFIILFSVIDFTAFCFIISYIYQLLRYYIFASIRKRRAQQVYYTTTSTRRATPSSSSSSVSRSGQNSTLLTSEPLVERSQRRRDSIPTASRAGQRTVRTQSSTARTTKTAKTSQSRTQQQRRKPTVSSQSSAERDPGIEITSISTRHTTIKVDGKDIYPVGRPTRDDLKCIICYMDFVKTDKRKVILCPHCHYPAHEDEFIMWLQTSKLCARCNKEIPKNYVLRPQLVLTVKEYIVLVIEKI